MIRGISNIKHQCVIGLLYSAGFRVKELINLRNSDFDFSGNRIHITSSKDDKIRSVPLSSYLMPFLKAYRKCYENDDLTFQGYKSTPLTARAIQRVVKDAAQKIGIEREVNPTMLRNSFAIHLLQARTKPELVRELLGLESDQPLQRFIFAANKQGVNLKSPMDQ